MINDENQFAIDKPLKRKNLQDEQKKMYLGKGFLNSLFTYLNKPLYADNRESPNQQGDFMKYVLDEYHINLHINHANIQIIQ